MRKAQNEEWVELGKSLQDEFQRNQRRFWRRVTNRSERREAGRVCDENGVVIADEDRVVDRWKEYFASLLCGNTQSKGKNIQKEEAVTEEQGIGVEEVAAAIAKLKGGKALGMCGINAEMLKAGGSVTAEWLHTIVNLMWTKGEVPDDWRKAIIVPIHKKGSELLCSNYRGISLLSEK